MPPQSYVRGFFPACPYRQALGSRHSARELCAPAYFPSHYPAMVRVLHGSAVHASCNVNPHLRWWYFSMAAATASNMVSNGLAGVRVGRVARLAGCPGGANLCRHASPRRRSAPIPFRVHARYAPLPRAQACIPSAQNRACAPGGSLTAPQPAPQSRTALVRFPPF